MQRRVEEPDRHRETGHRLEDRLEVPLLHREQQIERLPAGTLVRREDHLLHHREALRGHEHVLGAAEADALGTELAGLGGVPGRVGVGADPEPPEPVRPAEDRLEVLVDRGRHERDCPDDHPARAAVDREQVPLSQLDVAERHSARDRVDPEHLAARDARLPHPAGDDRGVGRHPAVRRQDAAGMDQPMDVVRGRLPADEDDVVPGAPALLGEIRVEHDRARRGTRRRVEAGGHDLHVRVGVDPGVEQLVELIRVDPGHGLLARDQLLAGHLHGDPQRCLGRPLAASRLEQEQPAVLDRELDVLHLAVVLLEALERVGEFGVRVGQHLPHPPDRLGRTDSRDDVLALGVDEELPEERALAGGRVAGEADPGPRRLPLVAEHHLHDVHRGPEIVRDVVGAAIDPRARRLPRVEHGADGAAQLLARVLGERDARLALVDRLEGRDQLAQVVRRQLDVLADVASLLERLELALEEMPVDAVDHLAVHLDQPPVRVEREPRVSGGRREPLDRDVVQAEVQDRVHHPGHRDRRAGADRDE